MNANRRGKRGRTVIVLAYPLDRLGNGVVRRVDHLRTYYGEHGTSVDLAVIGGTSASPLKRRVQGVANLLRLALSSRAVHFHIIGLMQPAASRYASFAYSTGHETTLDTCDSLTLIAASAEHDSAVAATAGTLRRLQQDLPAGIKVSYISQRDLEADASLNGSRATFVVPAAAPASLSELPPIQAKHVERFVLAGDFDAYHVREGVAKLETAWRAHCATYTDAQLDVFGMNTSRIEGWPNCTIRGFAPDIAALYEGASVTLVPNVFSSGVPNKLIEAVAAQRPVVAHQSLKRLVAPHPWFLTYDDVESLTRSLSLARDLRLDVPVEPMRLASSER